MVTVAIIDGPTLACDDDGWAHYAYTVRLSFEGRTLESPWSQGTALLDPPTASDVLQAMLSEAFGIDDADGFEDWASSFGYDPDSRKAERLYNACAEQSDKLRAFLGEHYDKAREMETEDAARSLTAI